MSVASTRAVVAEGAYSELQDVGAAGVSHVASAFAEATLNEVRQGAPVVAITQDVGAVMRAFLSGEISGSTLILPLAFLFRVCAH